MKHMQIFLFLATITTSSSYGQKNRDGLLGTYLTANKESKIEFYEHNQLFYGKVVWKAENSDSKATVGDVIIKDLKYNASANSYDDGTLVWGSNELNCNAIVMPDNQLKVRMKLSFFKKEVIWTRTEKQ